MPLFLKQNKQRNNFTDLILQLTTVNVVNNFGIDSILLSITPLSDKIRNRDVVFVILVTYLEHLNVVSKKFACWTT